MARGTPLKWVQDQGGWTTAKLLLDSYGHFMPSEHRGFSDALSTALAGPQTAPTDEAGDLARIGGAEFSENMGPYQIPPQPISPRSPIMHFTDPPPFL
jgi:hypothetical protein